MFILFDWFSLVVPFGLAEIFDYFSSKKNFTIPTSLLDLSGETPKILSAVVLGSNDQVVWERWRKEREKNFSVSEIKIENQRYFFGWTKPFLPNDPPGFTDLTRAKCWKEISLAPGWHWTEEWRPRVVKGVTDENGWVYAKNFFGWNSVKIKRGIFDFVRTRIFTRRRLSNFKTEYDIDFEEGIKPRGKDLVDRIQYGIKTSLLKDHQNNDFKGRNYFFLCDNTGQNFQFQDYAPKTFANIREMYGINQTQYLKEICDSRLLGGEKNDAGKSGQIFWRSSNNEFVIKTVTHQEATFLQKNLERYFNYLCGAPNTLISRFYGLHKIKGGWLRLRFIVMNNVFSTCTFAPQLIYDLKGTTEDRLVKQSSKLKKQPILKDLNFSDRFILVPKPFKKAILQQIKSDSDFFKEIGVMDYSLLLGVCVSDKLNEDSVCFENVEINLETPVERKNVTNNEKVLSKTSVFENGIQGSMGETYYIGIIDVLQNWTKKKRIANAMKTLAFFDCHQRKIDSVPPKTYCHRFYHYFRMKIRDAVSLGYFSKNSEDHRRYLVKCTSAVDLKISDSFGFNSCNPYVVIQYGDRQCVTSIVRNNNNPVWSYFCSFPIKPHKPKPKIYDDGPDERSDLQRRLTVLKEIEASKRRYGRGANDEKVEREFSREPDGNGAAKDEKDGETSGKASKGREPAKNAPKREERGRAVAKTKKKETKKVKKEIKRVEKEIKKEKKADRRAQREQERREARLWEKEKNKPLPTMIQFTVLDSELGFRPSLLGLVKVDTALIADGALHCLDLDLLSQNEFDDLVEEKPKGRNKASDVQPRENLGKLKVSVELLAYAEGHVSGPVDV